MTTHRNFLVLILFLFVVTTPIYGFSLTTSEPVKFGEEKRSIVSPNGLFKLGIFNATSSSEGKQRWYLGIRYRMLPRKRSLVWVGNRDDPLHNSRATLKISNTSLVLLDQSESKVWTKHLKKRINVVQPVVGELLDNGNFVLRYPNSSSYLWESFDFPTDTLLPGMKLGWDRRRNQSKSLKSWKSSNDPSIGHFVYKIDNKKPWQGLLFENDKLEHRTNHSYRKLVGITEISTANVSSISLLKLTPGGKLELFVWSGQWNSVWYFPKDLCDLYDRCGSNSYCHTYRDLSNNTKDVCTCIYDFEKSGDTHARTCVRKSQLSCDNKLEYYFKKLKNMKLPDFEKAIVDSTIGFQNCNNTCLRNCSCTAFAIADMQNGGSACVLWTGDLVDLRNYSIGGQDLYVKLLVPADHLGEKRKMNKKTIIGSAVGGCVLLLLSLTMFCIWMRRKKRAKAIAATNVSQERIQDLNTTEDWGSKSMEFDVIATATDYFSESNELGKGGFGIVYKGRLRGGQEIAVKRLSKMSPRAVEGFTSEAKLIAVVQHVNLVRLIGFCSNADEKILVYEFLENSSLDSYLFDTTRGCDLTWENRFDITNGIVRGLIYLHQDSRFRIIHLDLKPSNILLDKDMIPKISDFGMAKTLGGDETQAHVTTVAGTFGYIAPEYRNDGVFSVKTDVFSFGVLLLEIITGKRNIDFLKLNDGSTLLSYLFMIWNHWIDGKGLEIVDPAIKDSLFPSQQVLQCIQIGLLCVQELPEDRPTMPSVGLMLGRELEAIPQPKSPVEIGSSSTGKGDSESGTVPEMTMLIEGR